MRVPIRQRLAPGSTQKSLQIPIMRCSAVASLLAYFFSRRQARSRFCRALLAGISNALHNRIAALLRERYYRQSEMFFSRPIVGAVTYAAIFIGFTNTKAISKSGETLTSPRH